MCDENKADILDFKTQKPNHEIPSLMSGECGTKTCPIKALDLKRKDSKAEANY